MGAIIVFGLKTGVDGLVWRSWARQVRKKVRKSAKKSKKTSKNVKKCQKVSKNERNGKKVRKSALFCALLVLSW